jgi:hypothetical protein
MSLLEVFKAALVASALFSWITLLIACWPTILAFSIASTKHRWQYVIAGLLGAFTGEFCGVLFLFLSLWLSCRGHEQSCNTAQGGMGIIITLPIGSLLGNVLALFWTRMTLRIPPENPLASICSYSGPSRIQNWTYAIAIPIAFWGLVTLFFAHLMA